MKKTSQKAKKLPVNAETIRSLEGVELKMPAGGYWSSWSVTQAGGPTCVT